MKDKNDYKDLVVLVLGIMLIFATIFWINTWKQTQTSKYELKGECNSGFIGIDGLVNFNNKIVTDKYNYSYNKAIEQPHHLSIKNIDGLNCKIKIKGEIPTYLIESLIGSDIQSKK